MVKTKSSLIIITILLISLASSVFIKIPFIINSKGIISPLLEWRLEKSSDGIIINTIKDNLTNSVPHFSSTEFQRGDHISFTTNKNLLLNSTINKGDTIGFINSHLENLSLIKLQGDLDEKTHLRNVYLSGDKTQTIEAAYQELMLAKAEL